MGEKVLYDGNYKDDKKDGYGTGTYDNGDTWSGQWKDDKKNGEGTLLYTNGKKFEGKWENDILVSGKGYLLF